VAYLIQLLTDGRLGAKTSRAERNGNNVNIKLAAATLGAAIILAGSPAFAADMQSGPASAGNAAAPSTMVLVTADPIAASVAAIRPQQPAPTQQTGFAGTVAPINWQQLLEGRSYDRDER
jgi:hypothetical protein